MPSAPLLDQMVPKLRAALGCDLVSVVLYGSAVSGDYNAKFSDYNVLCVLTQITPAQLRATEPIFRWWREQGNPSPLLLTETEICTATDCFPIEFHDIQDQNRILFGPDLISQMVIEDTFYRAQVEHDLRTRLMRLRQKASGVLSDKDVLRRLLIDSVSTFCVLFRHALALRGVTAPGNRREIVRRAGETFAVNPRPFEQLLDVREEKLKAKELDPEPLLTACIQQVEKVIEAVDGMLLREETTA